VSDARAHSARFGRCERYDCARDDDDAVAVALPRPRLLFTRRNRRRRRPSAEKRNPLLDKPSAGSGGGNYSESSDAGHGSVCTTKRPTTTGKRYAVRRRLRRYRTNVTCKVCGARRVTGLPFFRLARPKDETSRAGQMAATVLRGPREDIITFSAKPVLLSFRFPAAC